MDLGRLSAYRHDGFWVPLDTIKEKQALDDMYNNGQRPWCVWEEEPLAALDEP
jgi:glucose-1-phosphate cytidylyltransferase